MHFIHTFKGVNNTLIILNVEGLLETVSIASMIVHRFIYLFNSISEIWFAEVFLIYRKIDDKWSQQILFELPES